MPAKIDENQIVQDFCKMPREEFFIHASAYLAKCFDVECVVIATFGIVYKQHVNVQAAYGNGKQLYDSSYVIDSNTVSDLLTGSSVEKLKDPHQVMVNGQSFPHQFIMPILNARNKVIGHLAFFSSKSKFKYATQRTALNAATFRLANELEREQQSTKIEMLNLGLSLPKGELYFSELVKLMTRYLNVDYAFIGNITEPDFVNVELRAMTEREIDIPLDKYSLPIPNIPPTVRQPYVMQMQPTELPLNGFRSQVVSCVIGIYLFGKNNQVIGVLGVMTKTEVDRIQSVKSLLDSFSLSASRELENQTQQRQLDYYTGILEGTSDLLSFIDRDYTFCAVNDAYQTKFGLPKEHIVQRPVALLYGEKNFESIIKPSLEKAFNGVIDSVEFSGTDMQGNEMVLHAKHHPYHNAQGDIVGAVMSCRDMTGTAAGEVVNQPSESWLQVLYDKTPSMFFTVDQSLNISSANAFVTQKLGFGKSELAKDKLHNLYCDEDKELVDHFLNRCFQKPDELHEWEMRMVTSDGNVIWAKQSAQVVEVDNCQPRILLASEDITEKHQYSLELSYQASHDSLTGLANRIEFERAMHKLIDLPEDHEATEHVLCYIDLDNFKQVNDECGHPAGDELLKNIAALLKLGVRRNDVICRIGGDEFTIIMANCGLDKGVEIAQKMCDAIAAYSFIWKGVEFKVGASIGITKFTHTKQTFREIVTAADDACYCAKKAGRNTVYRYDCDSHLLDEKDVEMSQIRDSITEERFELFAQPVFKIADMTKVVSYEFLLRMRHQGGLIPASQFMHLARRFDALMMIDRWVITQAFTWMDTNRHNLDGVRCNINLSTISVSHGDFLQFVVSKLKQHDIDGSNICFEITEMSAHENLQGVVNFMAELAKYKTRFILDNFGGDASLLGHIKTLPVDIVKIDGTLVSCLTDQAINLATIKAINDIAHVVEKSTVATFVEDEETLKCLQEIGVDYVQGDLLGVPKPLATIH